MLLKFFKCLVLLTIAVVATQSRAQNGWRIVGPIDRQIESIALIFLKLQVPADAADVESLRRTGTQDDVAMKIMGDRIAKVMSNAGMTARYVGSFSTKQDYAETLAKDDGEFKLVYLPTGISFSGGGWRLPRYSAVEYLVALYPPGSSKPVFEAFTNLTRQPKATVQDLYTRQIIKGFTEAKIYSLAGKTIVPTPIGEEMPMELMARP